MEIYSKLQPEKTAEFNKLKKSKKWSWEFLCKGEWSQTIYHQGNIAFDYGYTQEKDYWALMNVGFPKRIVCIAKTDPVDDPNKIVGAMLHHLYVHDGDYIDSVDDECEGLVNFRDAWDEYERLKRRKK